MVVANNDRPLGPEERQAEYGRIERFVNEPPSWSANDDRKRKRRAGEPDPESAARRFSL